MLHMWIVVPTTFEELKLLAGLKQRGYTVSVAAADGTLLLITENCKSGIVACRIEREALTAQAAYHDVAETLFQNNLEYYGLVISEFSTNATWDAGNAVDDKALLTKSVQPNKINLN